MCRPQSEEDWESRKAVILELYPSHQLMEIKQTMENEHFFKATVDQYKKRFQKWGLKNKRNTDHEYRYMVNKERKRRQEDPEKETAFFKGGEEIDQSKIDRYRKRKRISDADEISNASTPLDITCVTPPSIVRSPKLAGGERSTIPRSMDLSYVSGDPVYLEIRCQLALPQVDNDIQTFLTVVKGIGSNGHHYAYTDTTKRSINGFEFPVGQIQNEMDEIHGVLSSTQIFEEIDYLLGIFMEYIDTHFVVLDKRRHDDSEVNWDLVANVYYTVPRTAKFKEPNDFLVTLLHHELLRGPDAESYYQTIAARRVFLYYQKGNRDAATAFLNLSIQ